MKKKTHSVLTSQKKARPKKKRYVEFWRVDEDANTKYKLFYRGKLLGEGLTDEDLYYYFIDHVKEGGDSTEPVVVVLRDKTQERWSSIDEYLSDDVRSDNNVRSKDIFTL